jgi:hypothetical protein
VRIGLLEAKPRCGGSGQIDDASLGVEHAEAAATIVLKADESHGISRT